MLAPVLTGFPYPSPASPYSDFTITHFPNTLYIQRTIQEQHKLPLWSPAILSGYPFAANPLSGMWYPPNWLTWLLPLPFGMNLLVLLHLVWAGLGMYLLLGKSGRSAAASLFGAVGFALMPKVIAHYGAGHISLVQAVSWTPWLLVTSLEAQRDGKSGIARYLPAVILALIFLADVRWTVYACAAWLGWEWFSAKKRVFDRRQFFLWLRRMGFTAGLALLLIGPLLMPLQEYTALSTRVGLGENEKMVFSLPFQSLINLFVFNFSPGAHEWVIYPGSGVLILGLLGLFDRSRDNKLYVYWLLVCFLGVFLSFGDRIPGGELISRVPGISLLRVPPRVIFLVGMGMNFFAAAGFDTVFGQKKTVPVRYLRLVTAAWLTVIVVLTGFFVTIGGTGWSGWRNSVLGIGIGVLLIWRLSSNSIVARQSWFMVVALLLFHCLDLGLAAGEMVYFKSNAEVRLEKRDLAEWLAAQDQLEPFRVYSPSYSLPQHQAVDFGLEMADGVDPLQLAVYVDFMEKATGVQMDGYSVTVPAFPSGDPTTANRLAVIDGDLLGLLNVKYVITDFELVNQDMALVGQIDDVFIYQNHKSRPRAWIDQNGRSTRLADVERLIIASPNKIEVHVSGPGRLVLSEINYPGWHARLDGMPADIDEYRGVIRSVDLAPGSHVIVYEYLPVTLLVGLVMQAAGVIILMVLYLQRKRRLRSDETN